ARGRRRPGGALHAGHLRDRSRRVRGDLEGEVRRSTMPAPARRRIDTRRLAGRVALVTGAASGIGRATALAFARAGADLVLCDLDERGLARTTADAEAMDRAVLARRVDVAKREEMRAFAD